MMFYKSTEDKVFLNKDIVWSCLKSVIVVKCSTVKTFSAHKILSVVGRTNININPKAPNSKALI